MIGLISVLRRALLRRPLIRMVTNMSAGNWIRVHGVRGRSVLLPRVLTHRGKSGCARKRPELRPAGCRWRITTLIRTTPALVRPVTAVPPRRRENANHQIRGGKITMHAQQPRVRLQSTVRRLGQTTKTSPAVQLRRSMLLARRLRHVLPPIQSGRIPHHVLLVLLVVVQPVNVAPWINLITISTCVPEPWHPAKR